MHDVLKEYLDKFCISFLDDILIYSKLVIVVQLQKTLQLLDLQTICIHINGIIQKTINIQKGDNYIMR